LIYSQIKLNLTRHIVVFNAPGFSQHTLTNRTYFIFILYHDGEFAPGAFDSTGFDSFNIPSEVG